MGITIERLRTGIVVLAIALVAAIGVFLFVARYERRKLIKDLPARLGIQIQESADSFTVSKSEKGHTLFALHASKAVQYKGGGHATLHDVSITLYGPQGDRSDHIYGADFDYDPKSGIASALGEVDIDFQAPVKAPPGQAAPTQDGADGGKSTIHVKAIGLVFNKNDGTATTSGLVEFRTPQGAGHATGASYDSQAGVLVLDSGVELNTSSGGKAVSLHASHAQIVRNSRQAFLLNPIADYQTERTTADQAIVYFREDGTAEHIDAKGHIHVTSDGGQDLKAGTAQIMLDADSQPQHADIAGGLFFVSTDQIHHMRGTAVEGKAQFGADASLRHLQLLDAVSFVDEQRTLPDDPNGSNTREVRAAKIDADFAPGPDGRALAQQVLATGNATVVLHTISIRHPQQNTTIAADQLLATIVSGNAVNSLTGSGHTKITDIAANGTTQTSTGDLLAVSFTPAGRGKQRVTAKAAAATPLPAIQIQSATQQGNVAIIQTQNSPQNPTEKNAAPMRITAAKAVYDSVGQALHVEGAPHLNDGVIDLTADAMDYQRGSGDALATGSVKATSLQQPGNAGPSNGSSLSLGGHGPAHIVSDSATMNRATGDAAFRGHARLWQDVNSIAAPVIELSRTTNTLKAHGDATGGRVDATLESQQNARRGPSTEHVSSRELVYSDHDRTASFSGVVVAKDASGTVHSDKATVYLTPPAPAGQTKPGPLPGQSQPGQSQPGSPQVDRVVAEGHIVLEQPGRRATGEKLVYTAQDGNFTLTGTPSNPPRMVDQAHGTVTGGSLIFNGRDDSVSVSGGRGATDARVRK